MYAEQVKMVFVMCALKRCPKKSTNKHVKFYKIPKDPVRSKQWLRYCKKGTDPETGRVCSKHFMPSDYTEASESGEGKLKADAVPTPCADTKLHLQCSVKLERTDLNKLKELIEEESKEKLDTTAGAIPVKEEPITIGQQLNNLLQSGLCCCVCLRLRHDDATDAARQRGGGGAATALQLQLPGDRTCTLWDALWTVLAPEVSEIAETGYLCEKCTDSTISAYLFIQNAKDTANKLSKHLSNLQEEVDDMLARLEQGDDVHQIFFYFPDDVEPRTNENEDTKLFDNPMVDTDDDSARWEEDTKDETLTTADIAPTTARKKRTVRKKHMVSKIYSKRDKDTTDKKRKRSKKYKNCAIKIAPLEEKPPSGDLSRYEEHWKSQRAAREIRPQCLDCAYKTNYLNRFLEHVRVKHIRQLYIECPNCQAPFYSKSSFENHSRRCYVNRFICAHCDKEFHRYSAFVTHVTSCQTVKRAFACDKCDATFDGPTDVLTHDQKRHAPNKESVEAWISLDPCKVCAKTFTNYRDYTHHKKECNLSTDLLCPICGVCVKNMCRHLQRHQEVSRGRKHARRGILCELCGKWFRSRSLMQNHIDSFHLKLHVSCAVCGKRVKKASLKQHMKLHQENWDEIFERRKLKLLMRLTQCDECDYTTTSKFSMETHINRYHKKERPYKCETCGKSFFSKHLVASHARTHAPKSKYVCDQCGREYTTRAGVRIHIERDHSAAPRRYECRICGKGFDMPAKLARHRYIHMPSERCPVEHCGSMHSGWIATKKHLRKMHWKRPGRFDPALIPGMSPEAVERFGDRRGGTIPGLKYELLELTDIVDKL